MSKTKSVDCTTLWRLGIAMDNWRRARGTIDSRTKGEIGEVGLLFRRFLKSEYGLRVSPDELGVMPEEHRREIIARPLGVWLSEDSEFDPRSID